MPRLEQIILSDLVDSLYKDGNLGHDLPLERGQVSVRENGRTEGYHLVLLTEERTQGERREAIVRAVDPNAD